MDSIAVGDTGVCLTMGNGADESEN